MKIVTTLPDGREVALPVVETEGDLVRVSLPTVTPEDDLAQLLRAWSLQVFNRRVPGAYGKGQRMPVWATNVRGGRVVIVVDGCFRCGAEENPLRFVHP